ncbi:MAG: hypothetical protein WBV51_05880, partial [Pseudolabrys sp.]
AGDQGKTVITLIVLLSAEHITLGSHDGSRYGGCTHSLWFGGRAAPQLLPTFSLGVDDLGGMLLRIYNGNDHERISLFYRSTSSC